MGERIGRRADPYRAAGWLQGNLSTTSTRGWSSVATIQLTSLSSYTVVEELGSISHGLAVVAMNNS